MPLKKEEPILFEKPMIAPYSGEISLTGKGEERQKLVMDNLPDDWIILTHPNGEHPVIWNQKTGRYGVIKGNGFILSDQDETAPRADQARAIAKKLLTGGKPVVFRDEAGSRGAKTPDTESERIVATEKLTTEDTESRRFE